MSSKPYQALAGSVPHQALAVLAKHGRPLSTAELAEQLGQPLIGLPQLLAAARYGGALINYQRRGFGQLRWWRLPDMPAHPDALPDFDEQERSAVQAAEAAEEQQAKAPKPRLANAVRAPRPLKPAPPTVAGLRVAAWSTGELAIETQEHVIVFNPDEAKAVIALVRALPLAA